MKITYLKSLMKTKSTLESSDCSGAVDKKRLKNTNNKPTQYKNLNCFLHNTNKLLHYIRIRNNWAKTLAICSTIRFIPGQGLQYFSISIT